MRVLVATSQTQGQRSNDYCWTIDGELVRLPFLECDCGDRCGCTRGFAGMTSRRATTTAEVVERDDVTRALLTEMITEEAADTWRKSGLGPLDDDIRGGIDEQVDALIEIADWAGAGSVVERAGDYFRVRRPAGVG